MKDTKSRTSTKSIKEGWSIHVYDQKRHLRCTIEPSHIRALGLGIVLGMFLTVVITNLDLPVKFVSSPTQSRSVEQNELPAMIQVD